MAGRTSAPGPVRLLPAGPFALLAEVGGAAQAQTLYATLTDHSARGELPELVDLVPAARTVLAVVRPTPAGRDCLRRVADIVDSAGSATARTESTTMKALTGRVVELPIRYDGPDLQRVADLLGVGADEVVRWHAAAEYRVAFCGFAPGFGYLSGLPTQLHVPRLPTPRTRVPAGAVGLAGEFCGVYPRESPGGWQLIGRTDAALWDADREPAALLAPGTRVRFRLVRPA